eukprot:gene18779-11104_t
MPDSAVDRERYFQQGLDAIAAIPNLTSVAFPHLVGCGLAGGKWKSYRAMLNAFAEQVAPSATVYIVRLPINTGAGSKTNTKKAAGKSRKGGGSGGDDPVMQQPPKKPSQPGQRAPPPRLLILLDMNGTVLLRNKTRYYIRSGAVEFVTWLAAVPEVRLAFYTSMRYTNAIPAIERLLGHSWEDRVRLYDREYQKADPEGEEVWDTMRDLHKVWANEAEEYGNHFDGSNTLMLDDTMRKMREHPDNVVLVPTLDTSTILTETKDGAVLGTVRKYIEVPEYSRAMAVEADPAMNILAASMAGLHAGGSGGSSSSASGGGGGGGAAAGEEWGGIPQQQGVDRDRGGGGGGGGGGGSAANAKDAAAQAIPKYGQLIDIGANFK